MRTSEPIQDPLTPESPKATGSECAPDRPPERTGDSIARLFREHNGSLLRYLTARLRSAQEAKEVAQEAFEQVLGLRDSRTINLLHHYLWKTAANLATNRLQQRTNRLRLDELQVLDTAETRSPERLAAAAQEFDLLRRAIDRLDKDMQAAFVLVKFHGLTSTDAARMMGLTPQTVRKYVTQALSYCHEAVHGKAIKQGEPK